MLAPPEVIKYLSKSALNTKEGKSSFSDLILSEIGKNLNCNFNNYDDNQIKMFVDFLVSAQGLSVKEFTSIYLRIEKESK